MKNFFHVFLFVWVLVSFEPLYAEKQFEPGYAITVSQDTLRGFIEYRNWDKNPVRILFKSTREDQEKTLGLEELSGFYVHDEYYVKATVKVDDNPIRGEEMSYSRIQQTRTETVFLRMLARGVKSLGYYVDARGRQNFYIVTGDYSYELLTNYQYILKRNNSSSLVTNDSYKIQLHEYLSDCPAAQIPYAVAYVL